MASASSKSGLPMCAPPRPSIDTKAPVVPSWRLGTPSVLLVADAAAGAARRGSLSDAVEVETDGSGLAARPRLHASPSAPDSESRQKSERVSDCDTSPRFANRIPSQLNVPDP